MRTLIILGHPDRRSFCGALADSYQKGAIEKGAEVERLDLAKLNFDPILRQGYKEEQKLEPDLVKAQRLIKWANHIVIVFPIWWSAPPALLKGFIDRVFLPGFAFKLRENSASWDRLLMGKSARLIMTSDAPVIWLYVNYFHPALNMMKKATLEFCGVSPVSVTSYGMLKSTSEEKKNKYVYETYRLGLDEN